MSIFPTRRLRVARGPWLESYGLLLPGLIFLAVFFVIPLCLTLMLSFTVPSLGLEHYRTLFFTSAYRRIFANTFLLATLVTAVSLALGLPVAWFLAIAPQRWSQPVQLVLILSMWTNLLARTYAWVVLLQDTGPINQTLLALHLIAEPLPLMNSLFAVTVGMTYIMLPFVVFPLRNRIAMLEPALFQAATLCGASRMTSFRRIFLPAIATTLGSAGVSVFVMSLGYYVTPSLLGSESRMVLAELIAQLVQSVLDWGLAGAAALVLLVMTLFLYGVQRRLNRQPHTTP